MVEKEERDLGFQIILRRVKVNKEEQGRVLDEAKDIIGSIGPDDADVWPLITGLPNEIIDKLLMWTIKRDIDPRQLLAVAAVLGFAHGKKVAQAEAQDQVNTSPQIQTSGPQCKKCGNFTTYKRVESHGLCMKCETEATESAKAASDGVI